MPQITPTPEPDEAVFTVAMAAGMRMAAELVYTQGPGAALGALGDTLQSTLSHDEMGILATAVRLILAQREIAPDDLSGLPQPPAASCADPACRICCGSHQ